jgi:hypothetical protein
MPDGTSCDDGNACTEGDTCRAGACGGGAPVVCPAGDACHDVAACNPLTGTCTVTPKTDGAPCDDGNACTTGDSCQSGACAAGAPVVCAGGDACTQPGVCDPATGACNAVPRPDGASCDDGNPCTFADRCQAGVCTGGRTIICDAPGDACHEAATCDPATGQCARMPKPDGTPCSDANKCTQGDTCEAGACTGGAPVLCVAPDDCHVALCRPRSGKCKVKRKQPFEHCRKSAGKGDDKGKGKH